MYAHHSASIEILTAYFRQKPDILAVLLGGSVAKGTARPDSDIDAIVVVTDSRYETLRAAHRLSETIDGLCTYPGGYFDIKYCTLAYLEEVADHGSEPARVSFEQAVCLWSPVAGIESILRRIPVFQQAEKPAKQLAFYSAMELNQSYFWDVSAGDLFLRTRALTDIVLFGLRLFLQDREILFPCNKSLLAVVRKQGPDGEALEALAQALLRTGSGEDKNAFVSFLLSQVAYTPPAEYAEVLTSYINHHELWWHEKSPVLAEW